MPGTTSLESLDPKANVSEEVAVSDGTPISYSHPKPRYTLAELLAQCDVSAPRTTEDAAWLNDRPARREGL